MSSPADKEEILPLVPLRNLVVFPGVSAPLRVGRPASVSACEAARKRDSRLLLVAQRRRETSHPSPAELYGVGTVCEISISGSILEGGSLLVVAGGQWRAEILEYVQDSPHYEVKVRHLDDVPDSGVPDELRRTVNGLAIELLGGEGLQAREQSLIDAISEHVGSDNVLASVLDVDVAQKQSLLEERDARRRYERLAELLRVEVQVAKLGARIRAATERDTTDTERRRYLTERKEQIEEQLREFGDSTADYEHLQKRLAEAGLPPEAQKEADRELSRLIHMRPGTPEYGVAEDFLNWIVDLPWSKSTEEVLELTRAQGILDRDHYDREEVKERILEYLAVRKLSPQGRGQLLCLVGPPGVGKTSLGRSIAEATGREFYRISLGGVHDDAEIRGHRRTYLGALPGRIIQALCRVGVNNPVFMLDEIDKLARSIMGDPSAALLEVLDPEQNSEFVDNYISVPFDLSRIMFIATANTTATISSTLLDRLEVIKLPGYSTDEKTEIAARYLVPKQLEEHGLSADQLGIEKEALAAVVERYTRESGVRQLERQIASLCRKVARLKAGGSHYRRQIQKKGLAELLGPPRFAPPTLEESERPGLCLTPIASPNGGQLAVVEALRVEGRGRLVLTGRLGEVLGESAQTAFSFVKSKADDLGLLPERLGGYDYHIHFSAANVPKEGTSAGLAVALALFSLLSDSPLPPKMAVAGEITLMGRVLPVGDLREKLVTAKRAGVVRLMIPEGNRSELGSRDLRVPAEGMELNYVDNVNGALLLALPGVAARKLSQNV